MIIRPARLTDFAHLETFVWQAIFPAFDVEGLTADQRAENDALIENARTEVVEVLDQDNYGVFVAMDTKSRSLAGYVIADARPRAYAEISRLIVKRNYHGKGVGELLLDEATEFIGRDRAVSLSVRHYNLRAMAFFGKHGFVDTGETTGDYAIPRTLMLREAHEVAAPSGQTTTTESASEGSFGFDFPSASDEPVFEELPDYNLITDEDPLFATGANALRADDPEEIIPDETTLSEDQLSVLEAFIARARAQKNGNTTSGKTSVSDTSAPVLQPSSGKQPKPVTLQPRSASKPAFDRSAITFEVDYGDGALSESHSAKPEPASAEPATSAGPSFSFDFTPVAQGAGATEHVVAPSAVTETTNTPDNGEGLPSGASARDSASREHSEEPLAEAKASGGEVKSQSAGTSSSSGSGTPLQEAAKTKICPDCSTDLPAAARFCFVCGHPQPAPEPVPENPAPSSTSEKDELEELLLEELPPLPDDKEADDASPRASVLETMTGEEKNDEPASIKSKQTKTTSKKQETSGAATAGPITRSELRQDFRKHLQDRVLAYFGDRKLKKFITRLDEDTAFQQVRDGSLSSLFSWLEEQPAADLARARRRNTFADLTEYFIVETAGDLSGNVLPQRLLRHQSVNWQTADLFKLVMDYLDFPSEAETIYTDFVTMSSRALKNATRSFLHAAKDERVFFICDQSLISQAKNGFAVTDAGIYWKNVLQPAGAATFTTMREPRLEQGHVIIEGQFFDAGARLNLKIAVLLDKLRRMR